MPRSSLPPEERPSAAQLSTGVKPRAFAADRYLFDVPEARGLLLYFPFDFPSQHGGSIVDWYERENGVFVPISPAWTGMSRISSIDEVGESRSWGRSEGFETTSEDSYRNKIGNEITFYAYVRAVENEKSSNFFFGNVQASVGTGYNWGFYNTASDEVQSFFKIGGAAHSVAGPNIYADGKPHFLCATYSQSDQTFKLYVDGEFVGAKFIGSSSLIDRTNFDTSFNRWNNKSTQAFALYSAGVFDRGLDQYEIAALFARRGMFYRAPSPFAYDVPFVEPSGPIYDETARVDSTVAVNAAETYTGPIYVESAKVESTVVVTAVEQFGTAYPESAKIDSTVVVTGAEIFTPPLPVYQETALVEYTLTVTGAEDYTGPDYVESAKVDSTVVVTAVESFGTGFPESARIESTVLVTGVETWTPPAFDESAIVPTTVVVTAFETFDTPSRLPGGISVLSAEPIGGFIARKI